VLILIGFFGFDEAVVVVEVDGVGVAVWGIGAAFRVGGWRGSGRGRLRCRLGAGWDGLGCGSGASLRDGWCGGNGERSFASLRMTHRGNGRGRALRSDGSGRRSRRRGWGERRGGVGDGI
jgi:hypothetical protein